MEREDRYLVFKRKDIEELFTEEAKAELRTLASAMYQARSIAGKSKLNCVIVEDDWPEYEEVWDMIEKRVNGGGTTRVSINGKDTDISTVTLSYEDLILACGCDTKLSLTVVYSVVRPDGYLFAGSLTAGKSVCVEEGMTLNILDTGNA